MFTSFRVFTLKTEPANSTVKRNRTDFKWLVDKLEIEFPSRFLPQIDKTDLNKKIIEEYFHTLIEKEGLENSRYIKYFLTTDDKMFEERKNSEDNFVGNLMSKLKKPGVTLEELKIYENKKVKVISSNQSLTSNEEGHLQLHLDVMQESLRVFTDTYKQ